MKDTNQNQDKFLIRLPDGLRESIKKQAEANGRSMNAEIVLNLMANDIETLRDKFAGKALAGLMSATDRDGMWTAQTAVTNAAKIAYAAADAMIAAREGGES